jgi:hypothetical protein
VQPTSGLTREYGAGSVLDESEPREGSCLRSLLPIMPSATAWETFPKVTLATAAIATNFKMSLQ